MSELTHVIFDVDETLYPREVGLLREINRRITLWVCEHCRLTADEAERLRQCYFQQYGTTVQGLIAERQIDVEDYLAFVHDVPPRDYLQPDRGLALMLAAIPLHRVVFTNAPAEHGWRVLTALGVADLFEQVVGIREVGLCSKPHDPAYRRLLELLGTEGPSCIMVEDHAVNLGVAKRLGMTTILVDGAPAEGVDFVVERVLEVGDLIARLLAGRVQGHH
ncbi:MAG: pyrimidine 5'-nucleotidase [Anaerolineae bacterium]|nr:pyrimidine 5'-nucleotidase [Anaerolineae bacterium]